MNLTTSVCICTVYLDEVNHLLSICRFQKDITQRIEPIYEQLLEALYSDLLLSAKLYRRTIRQNEVHTTRYFFLINILKLFWW